ncbi:MAG: hypothetical protein KatS3mg110_3475 [Pirellulaceae bacterium]|nr:MAG: hypothetical protein KatS3mg110_3475 [Pirellulaceae bacterium]
MKSRAVLPAVLAVGVLAFVWTSNAQAFELLDRILYAGGCGCEVAPKCCAPEPKCCGPRLHVHRRCEPKCGAEVTCGVEKVCGRERCWHLGSRLHDWLHRCGCEPACGVEAKCAVEPSCGIEKACRARCRPLFHHCRPKCGCGYEPACGVEMAPEMPPMPEPAPAT